MQGAVDQFFKSVASPLGILRRVLNAGETNELVLCRCRRVQLLDKEGEPHDEQNAEPRLIESGFAVPFTHGRQTIER